jgi:hypothetical protein
MNFCRSLPDALTLITAGALADPLNAENHSFQMGPQAAAQGALKRPDAVAQRWLGHSALLGCAGEVERTAQCHEISYLRDLQVPLPDLSCGDEGQRSMASIEKARD